MKIFVPGGCGYIGSALGRRLLADGHKVVIYDTQWFGSECPDNENVKLIKGDVRNIKDCAAAMRGCDAVIYLAGMTNNDNCKLYETFAQSVNLECFSEIVKAAEVKRFVFLSSVAVYGSSDELLTEDSPLAPSTLYADYKTLCEAALLTYSHEWVILRPATACGYAPRMRFDTTLNKMVRDGMVEGRIFLNGGSQIRSFIDIRDLLNVICLSLTLPKNQVFNVVDQNLPVCDIALLAEEVTGAKITVNGRTDNRSYAVSGEKLKNFWSPTYTLQQSAQGIVNRFKDGWWKDAKTNPVYGNIYHP